MTDREPAWKLALRAAGRLGLMAALFIAAGRIGWREAWVFAGLILLILAVNLTVILTRNPALLRQRMKKDAPDRPFDKMIIGLSLPLSLAVFVIAGLDAVRFGWSSVPLPWLYVGAALFLLGDLPIAWAMAMNPYLERIVRIQEDRGHSVITTGPYRIVRHPMYTGVLIMCAGWPLVLGSLWAYLPVGLLAILVVVRAALEDRTLRQELPGYDEYAQRTRYRLLPGVW
jgi:protein-S-isoprenylcysteine O-methyltransferase Ste14